jgi:hypothetical protein
LARPSKPCRSCRTLETQVYGMRLCCVELESLSALFPVGWQTNGCKSYRTAGKTSETLPHGDAQAYDMAREIKIIARREQRLDRRFVWSTGLEQGLEDSQLWCCVWSADSRTRAFREGWPGFTTQVVLSCPGRLCPGCPAAVAFSVWAW